MDKIKPWQIVLIVVALAAIAFSAFRLMGTETIESQMADSLTLVDAQTGQRYTASLKGENAVFLPARNPDTKKIALLPIYEEDGQWYVWERYRTAIDAIEVPTDAIPDINKAVRVTEDKPIRIQ